MYYYLIIVLTSVGAAFFSGLLGIGGGIILIPSYLYLLPALGFGHLSVNTITGITAVQATAGSFFSFINHSKFGMVNKKVVHSVAIIAIPAAFAGTILSKFLSDLQLLIIYLFILTLAGLSVLIPSDEGCEVSCSYEPEHPVITNIIIFISTSISSSMGFGGAVNFIPILNHFYKIPMKSAIGTVTYLVFITTVATLLGKLFLGLVPFHLIPLIILGSSLGAFVGAKVSSRLSQSTLKIILFLVIFTIWIRILLTVIAG